jgi:hypothetical protein
MPSLISGNVGRSASSPESWNDTSSRRSGTRAGSVGWPSSSMPRMAASSGALTTSSVRTTRTTCEAGEKACTVSATESSASVRSVSTTMKSVRRRKRVSLRHSLRRLARSMKVILWSAVMRDPRRNESTISSHAVRTVTSTLCEKCPSRTWKDEAGEFVR